MVMKEKLWTKITKKYLKELQNPPVTNKSNREDTNKII